MKITTDEILDALKEASKRPETADGLTMREIVGALNVGVDRARDWVRQGIRSGLIVPVRVTRTSELTGVAQPVAGYAPASKNRKK